MDDDPLTHHLLHSSKGSAALNTGRCLAEMLAHTRKEYLDTLCSLVRENTLTGAVFSQLEEMEHGLVKAESDIRQAAIGMCVASTGALRTPADEEQQKHWQTALLEFEIEIDHFCQVIEQVDGQFGKLTEKVRRALNHSGPVPEAVYTDKVLKLAGPEDDDDDNEDSQLKRAICSSVFLSNFDKAAIQIPPAHVDALLEHTSSFLSPLKSYKLEGVFGEGAQGKVHKARLMQPDGASSDNPNSLLALKIEKISAASYRNIISEVALICGEQLTQFRHPNILVANECSVFSTIYEEYYLVLALEAMTDGSLSKYTKVHWPDQYLAAVVKQILFGLTYIHSMNIIHNDIKPGNLLLKAGNVKLADFGLSAQQAQYNAKQGGTVRYMPPEVAEASLGNGRDSGEYTTAIDIWSLGATMFELLENTPPYNNYLLGCLYDVIATTGLYLSKNRGHSSVVKNFFRQMTVMEPSYRPSANDLLLDPFIAKACPSSELAVFINQLKTSPPSYDKLVKHAKRTDL